MQITWLPKQNPELLVLSLGLLLQPSRRAFQEAAWKATRAPSRRQLLGSLRRGACLRSCLLLGLQGCVSRTGACSRYFKVLCRNCSSKISWGTVCRTVSGWLEQPSAHLLHGTGLFPPNPHLLSKLWASRGKHPLLSVFYPVHVSREIQRETQRQGAGPQTLDCPVSALTTCWGSVYIQ